ncbi:MAG: SH3 domain-containing protein [Betaproteobacteria bacterium]
MKKILITFLMGALAACASVAALAQEPVLTNRSTELRATGDDAAKVLQVVPEKTAVVVLQRQGAWQQVRVGGNTGWVRMMHLRGGSSIVAEQSSSRSSGILAAFSRLLASSIDRPRGSQRAQSATVGIRGFSREDVMNAELNPVELEKLKRFQASDSGAQQLARSGKLQFRSVAYLSRDAVEAANSQGARK